MFPRAFAGTTALVRCDLKVALTGCADAFRTGYIDVAQFTLQKLHIPYLGK